MKGEEENKKPTLLETVSKDNYSCFVISEIEQTFYSFKYIKKEELKNGIYLLRN